MRTDITTRCALETCPRWGFDHRLSAAGCLGSIESIYSKTLSYRVIPRSLKKSHSCPGSIKALIISSIPSVTAGALYLSNFANALATITRYRVAG